tara:strand:- start:372 stop:803 length:432 start_codon:yes stop_codon:yes gene_type:complete
MKSKKFRGYIFSRPFLGERVPQHIQNIVIREYCEKNNLHYLLSSTEYVLENSHLMLEQTLNELGNLKGIVAYSLFQLPQKKNKRLRIYKKILFKKKELHFSVENLKLRSPDDIDKLEDIWSVKQLLPETSGIVKYFMSAKKNT